MLIYLKGKRSNGEFMGTQKEEEKGAGHEGKQVKGLKGGIVPIKERTDDLQRLKGTLRSCRGRDIMSENCYVGVWE